MKSLSILKNPERNTLLHNTFFHDSRIYINIFTIHHPIYIVNINSSDDSNSNNNSNNTVYVVHEEGYGGCNVLGVFSTSHKAESSKKKFKDLYPNKYSSSSDFWNIRITEVRLDS